MRLAAPILSALVLVAACGDGDTERTMTAEELGITPEMMEVIEEHEEGMMAAGYKVGAIDGSHVVDATARFVRPVRSGAATTAGYLDLFALGDDALVAASSPDFGSIELHEATRSDGVMRMRKVDRIAVEAKRITSLEPGGLHLMMFDPKRPLEVGDEVTVNLTFESGLTLDLSMPVSTEDRPASVLVSDR